MSCPTQIELSRALVTQLDAPLRTHVEGCAACAAELAAHAQVADDVRALPIYDPTADHAREIRASLLAAAAHPSPAARPRWLWVGAAAALAATIALAVAIPRLGRDTEYRATLAPAAGAELVRVASAPDEIVHLTRGTLHVEVAALGAGERFRVVTGDGEVEVRGTAFDVTATDDRLTVVHVVHGRVEVRANGMRPVVLGAGEHWAPTLARAELPVDEPAAASSQVADAPSKPDPASSSGASLETAASTSSTGAVAPARVSSSSSTRKAAPASSSSTRQTAPTRAASSSSTRSAAPAQASSSAATSASTSTSTPQSARTAGSTSTSTTPEAGSARAASSSSPPQAAPARTASSASTSQPAPARTASSPSTAQPAPARAASSASTSQPVAAAKRPIEQLFETGWAALAAGDADGAATTFERAARAAPDDPLAEDAWFWRASALARARRSSAVGALAGFLARYPHSPRAGEASAVLGWLVLDTDLARAEALFRAATSDRAPAVRASGTKGLAAVAQQRSNQR